MHGVNQNAHVDLPSSHNFSQYAYPPGFSQATQNVNTVRPQGHGNQQHPYAAGTSQRQMPPRNQHIGIGHRTTHERITSESQPHIPFTNRRLGEAIINPADTFTIDQDTWASLYEPPRASSSASAPRPTAGSGQRFQKPNESQSARPLQAQNPRNVSTSTQPSNSSMPSTTSVIDHQVNVHNVRHVHIYHNNFGGSKN